MKDMRLYFYDDSGRALFFLEVVYIEFLDEYQFHHSLYLHIEKMAKYTGICQSFLFKEASWRQRTSRLNQLGLLIKQDRVFEPHYFPDLMLTANEQYNDFYDEKYEHIIDDSNFPDYTVFSADNNPIYFYLVKRYFYGHVLNEPEYLSREQYQKIINNHHQLQNKYVEFLGPENQFYITPTKDEAGIVYDIYFMTTRQELHFFFTRQRPAAD